MSALRILALAGLAGLLAFLPFGIAGQQISLAVGLAALLLDESARRRAGRLFGRGGAGRPLLFGVAAWGLASLLALVLSGHAAEGVRELRKLLLLGAIVLPAVALESERERRGAAFLLLLALGVAAALGIAEQLRGAGNHPTRLDGPIGFYMTTAGVFLLLSTAALALATLPVRLGALPAATFLLGGAGVILTYTRGAWFALAAAAAFLLARRHRKLALPALLLFAALLLLAPAMRSRLATSWDRSYDSNRERAWVYEAGLRAFREKPWFGHGLQDLRPVLESHRDAEARDPLTHFHSLYLQTAVSMGVVGVLALVLLVITVAAALRRASARARDPLALALAEGAMAALLAFLVEGVFEWNLGDSEVATALWTIVGLGLAASAPRPSVPTGDRSASPR